MKWEKKGLIYKASFQDDWKHNSALNPTPLSLDDRIRVFVGFRDKHGVSRIGHVDLNKDNPSEIISISNEPVLDIGEPGAFDDNGVVPTVVVENEGKLLLYYAGYQLHTKVRMSIFTGLAISNDKGKTFIRYKTVPIMDRTNNEKLFRVIHSILIEDGIWKAYYSGGDKFINGKNKALPVYNIKCATSLNGFSFTEDNVDIVKQQNNEYRVARSQVIKKDGKYIMFYSAGSEEITYKIAYAESKDGLSWIRDDNKLGISLSQSGWDSEMMAFQSVIHIKDKWYMFYNGNNMGYEGFGFATSDEI